MKTLRTTTVALALALGLSAGALAQDRPTQQPSVHDTLGRNQELCEAFTGLAQRLAPHVVAVQRASGSHLGYGVVIEDGLVLTASSVARGSGPFQVTSQAGACSGELVGRNEANDVALLRLDGAAPGPIALGSDGDLTIGQFVVTLGTDVQPLCVGVVSAKDRPVAKSEGPQKNVLMGLFSDGNDGHQRNYPSVLQHDGPLQPEYFGAPLVDAEGRLVGINVAIPFRGSSHAVGIDQIRTVLDGLKAGQIDREQPRTRPRTGDDAPKAGAARPWLGVSGVPAPADRLGIYGFGLLVREVEGPAAAAGLQDGDVIVEVDGQTFEDMDGLAAAIRALEPGDEVSVKLIRDSKLETLSVQLGQR